MAKITKKTMFEVLRGIVNEMDYEPDGISCDELGDFIDNEIQLLDAKSEKARERTEAKRAEGDELRDLVYDHLTSTPQTITQITAAIDDPEVTAPMVTARLTQLVKAGKAQKGSVVVGEEPKQRTLATYVAL